MSVFAKPHANICGKSVVGKSFCAEFLAEFTQKCLSITMLFSELHACFCQSCCWGWCVNSGKGGPGGICGVQTGWLCAKLLLMPASPSSSLFIFSSWAVCFHTICGAYLLQLCEVPDLYSLYSNESIITVVLANLRFSSLLSAWTCWWSWFFFSLPPVVLSETLLIAVMPFCFLWGFLTDMFWLLSSPPPMRYLWLV